MKTYAPDEGRGGDVLILKPDLPSRRAMKTEPGGGGAFGDVL